MTADRQQPNAELNRAILADGIARLEKELDAAERRAREAEARAKEAKSALAEVLLDKARGQKSNLPAGMRHDSPDDREIQSLRSELEAARRDLQQQEAKVQNAHDDAAEDLRLEYERRFHAARERMAQEFQKRLSDAQSAMALDARRQAAKESVEPSQDATHSETSHAPNGVEAEGAPVVAPFFGVFGARGLEGLRRHAFAIPLATFAGGLLLGWSALPGSSEPEVAAAKVAPLAAETAESTPAAAAAPDAAPRAAAEPAHIEAPEPIAETPPPAAVVPPVAETPPPAAAEPAPSPAPAVAADESETPQETPSASVADRQLLQDRNAALSVEIETLRRELDSASKRTKAVAAALDTERKKSAELARRAALAEKDRDEQARADDAAARRTAPQPDTSGTQERLRRSLFPFRIE